MQNNHLKQSKKHLAVLLANICFGLNVPFTKDLMQHWLSPIQYICIRVVASCMLFWLIGYVLKGDKVSHKDILKLSFGGLFGVIGAQFFVAVSLNHTSPIYFSLMSAMSPAIVLCLAAIFLKERITRVKMMGVIMGIAGALVLVMNNDITSSAGRGNLWGILIAFISVTSYAIYLIIIRNISDKYSAVTQMKWTYLSASIFLIPLLLVFPSDVSLLPSATSLQQYSEMAFIVVFATVISFILIAFGLKYLQATTVSVYINLQPVVAAIVAIMMGQDTLTWNMPLAAILVLTGTYMVSINRIPLYTMK